MRTLAHLQYSGIVNCLYSLNSPVFTGPMDARKSALLDRPNGGSAAEWDDYAASLGRPFWETELRFYGPESVMQAALSATGAAPLVRAKANAIAPSTRIGGISRD